MTHFYSWVSLLLSGSLLFCLSLSAQKQQNWRWQNPKPQGNTLRSMVSPNANTIFMAGNAGMIMKSTDGGVNWSLLETAPIIFSGDSGVSFSPYGGGNPSLASKSFNAVWMPKADPNKAVIVGNAGTIVASSDAGSNWEQPVLPVTVPIKDVWFFDGDNGFACGPEGTILRTKNCGKTWTLITQPIQRDLLTMAFPEDSTGFFGGEAGGIFTTPDGGATFSTIQTGFFANLTDVTFLDDSFGIARHQYGVAVGEFGAILRTENGGDDWEQSPIVTTDPIEAITRPRKPQFGNKLWIAGGKFGSFGRIWFSEDSAKTWKPQPIFSQFKFFDDR